MKKLIKILLILVFSCAVVMFLPVIASAADATADNTQIVAGRKSEIDVTHANDAFIIIRSTQENLNALRVQITYTQPGEAQPIVYTYNLDNEGNWETYTLQSGNGEYTVRVLENVEGTRFAVIQTVSIAVEYTSEFAPFLVSSQHVNFVDSVSAIPKAEELAGNARTDMERLEAIFGFIVGNISYDNEKATAVTTGEIRNYLPDIDYTVDNGKAICFGFSSTFAAMLRSQGVPTRLVMGFVPTGSGEVYHAWNEVFLEETGWVRINGDSFFDGTSWGRMDPTFAANNAGGRNTAFIGNGENYIKDKVY
jgi:hypothetical protein